MLAMTAMGTQFLYIMKGNFSLTEFWSWWVFCVVLCKVISNNVQLSCALSSWWLLVAWWGCSIYNVPWDRGGWCRSQSPLLQTWGVAS